MNYEKLMKKALEEFESFSLVWRDDFDFDEHCKSVEAALHPFLIKQQRTDEWPGTKIFCDLATVRFYNVEEGSIKIISKARSFKTWMAPSYPEDLAFYKGSQVVYSSIAHEGDEWENE